MISFIVIGRNEGWKLKKCLKSVFETIHHNNLSDSEIIYVDSKSTDGSAEKARTFKRVRVYSISGECNAAIARNIGAKEAKGDILFFIDGDMELESTFISKALNEKQELKYDYITGHLDDYLYTYDDEFLGVRQRTYEEIIPVKEQILLTNGGAFLIKKKIWNKVGRMKTKYRRSQDLDFSFRLKKLNIKLIRLPYLIVKHHTVDYKNEKRMWNNLMDGYILFAAMLFRDHIGSIDSWKRLIRSNYTAIALLVVVFCSVLFQHLVVQLLIILFIILFVRAINHVWNTNTTKNKTLFVINRVIYQIATDFIFWIGVIFFFPASKRISYKRLERL
ncbi:MAG: glycosyltransferase family 2 protein [Brumimicrobium sp.]